MTPRAILLGLLGACGVCGVAYFNDKIIRQMMFVLNNMPTPIYGGLILFILIVNPLLYAIYRRLALTGKELAVILALTLAACSIPGAGLLRNFSTSLMLPHYYNKTEPGWKENGLVDLVPPQMLADPSKNESTALNGFIQGLSAGGHHISLFDVPWYAWWRTLGFWIPLVIALWVALIGLAVVVHRQWSQHEQLPYPLAQFANALLPGQGRLGGEVFSSKLFWLAAITVMCIHLNNYAYLWYPEYLIEIPRSFDFSVLFRRVSETFMRGPYWSLTEPTLIFAVIGLAYFLPSETSFSMGLGPFLYSYVAGTLVTYGIAYREGGLQGSHVESFLFLGAFTGILLVLIYTGRHYYSSVFRRAMFLPAGDDVDRQSVRAAQVFLLGTAAFIANLVIVGLEWQLAVLYTAMLLMTFLVMGRIIAETGLFFLAPRLYPCALLLGIFGAQAVGPKMAIIMLVVSMILVLDPREALMPFMINSLKVLDLQRVRIGRTAAWCGVALVLGLAVGLPVTLYFQYDRGIDMSDRWATRRSPQSPFYRILQVKHRLEAQGLEVQADSLSGWERFKKMSPKPSGVISFSLSMAAVLLLSLARLRFVKWPLHPVMFLVWQTYPARIAAVSFLLGCVIKVAVTKYGGADIYQKLKPMMFGLIAGELLGGAIPMIIGFVYYLATGEIPKSFTIM